MVSGGCVKTAVSRAIRGELFLPPVSVRAVATAPKYRRLLGEKIRLYRRLSRLTQEKLAEKADLASTYISDIEGGRENISLDALYRIAESMGVGLEDLFAGIMATPLYRTVELPLLNRKQI